LSTANHTALHAALASWLNLVEVFFGIIAKQATRRGSFDSVKELVGGDPHLLRGQE
jgi:hypothetical protein